jgi:outer membrane protein OmpA-like peptidoglycan-associated protein
MSKKHKAGSVLKTIGVVASVMAMLACQEVKAQEFATEETSIQQKFEWDFYWFVFGPISEEIYEQLDEMIEFISRFPNETFLIVGHTDERGSQIYNKMLSQKRAEYIRNIMIQRGADPKKISPIGVAYAEPRVPKAKTEPEHTMNRRITLEFSSKKRVKELQKKIRRLK